MALIAALKQTAVGRICDRGSSRSSDRARSHAPASWHELMAALARPQPGPVSVRGVDKQV